MRINQISFMFKNTFSHYKTNKLTRIDRISFDEPLQSRPDVRCALFKDSRRVFRELNVEEKKYIILLNLT